MIPTPKYWMHQLTASYPSKDLWTTSVMIRTICNDIEVPLHAVPLTISNHQCRFLIGQYSVVEISYFFQKKPKMIKTWIVWWKATKNICKHEKTIWNLPTDPWCDIIRTRDTKERKYKWWQIVSGTQSLGWIFFFSQACKLVINGLQHSCFPMTFAKCLRTLILWFPKEHVMWGTHGRTTYKGEVLPSNPCGSNMSWWTVCLPRTATVENREYFSIQLR